MVPVYYGYERSYVNNLFPFTLHTNLFSTGNGLRIMSHWHEDIEILYFIQGSAKLTCGHSCYTGTSGEVAFIPPYFLHRVEPLTERCEYYCLKGNMNLIPPLSHFQSVPLPVVVTAAAQIINFMAIIIDEIHHKLSEYETVVYGQFLSMISCIYRNIEKSSLNSQNSIRKFDKIRKAIQYIQQHFTERISVKDICNTIGFSEAHFSRVFHEITGKTIVDYINHVRCEHAYHLICSGNYSIGQCAEMSGFSNGSYFSKKFQQIYGILPSKLGKEHP